MKKTNFCGIFATVFVVATVITLASCSQDDEFYEDGLFTRADEMMTRSGGEPGGGNNNFQYRSNECGIWCILYINKNVNSYKSYSALVDSATSSTVGWERESGAPLYGEQMQILGNQFGVNFQGWLSNHDVTGAYIGYADTKLTELFADTTRYDDNNKLTNVVICIRTFNSKGEMIPHYVVVKNYDEKHNKINVYDVNAPNASMGNYSSSVPLSNVLGVVY